jgi:drug/metabolite transporter (DMT)-like permease
VFGVLVALPAVALLSGEGRLLRPAEVVRSHVLGLALLVGTSIGLSGLFYSFIDEAAGLAPAAIAMTVGAVLLPAYAAARPAPTPYRSVGVPAVALGWTTAVAFMLSTAAYQRGVAAVVTALICLAPGVSILLAWRFLGERVARLQLVGGLLGVVVVVCFALAA